MSSNKTSTTTESFPRAGKASKRARNNNQRVNPEYVKLASMRPELLGMINDLGEFEKGTTLFPLPQLLPKNVYNTSR